MNIEIPIHKIKEMYIGPVSMIYFNFDCELEAIDIEIANKVHNCKLVSMMGKVDIYTADIFIRNGVVIKNRFGTNDLKISACFTSNKDACNFKLKM